MTTAIHPERVSAYARGDLAERLVPVAAELAFLVRDEDREGIGRWLDGHRIAPGDEEARALLVVLAAMVDVDATTGQMLSWVTFDEFGRPLPGGGEPAPATGTGAGEGGCGDYAAYCRHLRAGDPREQLELCGCAQAARDYWNERHRARTGSTAPLRSRPPDRIDGYARLRAAGCRITEAARRLRVHARTANKWERKLRDEGRATWRQDGESDAA
jgi:hypothetical protein